MTRAVMASMVGISRHVVSGKSANSYWRVSCEYLDDPRQVEIPQMLRITNKRE